MPEDGREKRLTPRREVFGHALILAPGIRVNCIIRDLSATGAKLGVPSEVKLPDEFHVLLLKTNSTRRVSLRWRHGDFAGVQFCRGETAPPLEPKGGSRPHQAETTSGVKSSWRGRR